MEQGRFATKGARYDHLRADRLRAARIRAELKLAEAAARLEMPILRYALLENGETEFVDPKAWDEAVARMSRAGSS
ncbi:MAG: hypothetical protein V4537_14345 [Pseudomonadota bacterium]